MKLQKIFNEVSLDKETHIYYDKNGKEYQAVSNFIGQFKNKFDPDGSILKNCAAREGKTEEELRSEWNKKAKDACDYGTGLHAEIEYYIKNKEIRDTIYKKYVKQFKKFHFQGELHSEQIIYSKKLEIAGTVDFIEIINDNEIGIIDFKSNKKLDKFSIYRKRMLPPLKHLHDCNFNLYQLQLSLYAYILDEECDIWVKNLSIMHINRQTETIDIHSVEYKRKEIISMLSYLKQLKEKTVEDFDF